MATRIDHIRAQLPGYEVAAAFTARPRRPFRFARLEGESLGWTSPNVSGVTVVVEMLTGLAARLLSPSLVVAVTDRGVLMGRLRRFSRHRVGRWLGPPDAEATIRIPTPDDYPTPVDIAGRRYWAMGPDRAVALSLADHPSG